MRSLAGLADSSSPAEHCAPAGANLIGMILWPKAKRSIPPAVARQIAAVARSYGAEPVAVFVDEDAATISSVCMEADVRIAQLHGEGARAAVVELQASTDLRLVYVMHAEKDGTLQTDLPQQLDRWATCCWWWCCWVHVLSPGNAERAICRVGFELVPNL